MSILTDPVNYEMINTCNKCGFCQANCIVYQEVLDEAYATRGRLRLIKAVADGQLERTSFYKKIIDSCLMCGECSKACPSGVLGHQLIRLARLDLTMIKGLSLDKQLILNMVLTNNKIRKFSFNSARVIKKVTDSLPALQSIRGIDLKSIPIADKDFLSCLPPENVNLNKNCAMKVGFFVGCLMNHTTPHVARSVVRILEANNCRVIVPKEQRCCGSAAHTYGHDVKSEEVAMSNIKLFNSLGVDKIVTACGPCGSMLMNYNKMFTEDEEQEAARQFSVKVSDLSKFLVDDLKVDFKNHARLEGKVTYHDPCQLVRGQNISSQPRKIISDIYGQNFLEMPSANKCCGAAGAYQFYYPKESAAITENKIAGIQKSDADYVVTSCPECVMRISGGLRQNKMPQIALHIAELFDPEAVSDRIKQS